MHWTSYPPQNKTVFWLFLLPPFRTEPWAPLSIKFRIHFLWVLKLLFDKAVVHCVQNYPSCFEVKRIQAVREEGTFYHWYYSAIYSFSLQSFFTLKIENSKIPFKSLLSTWHILFFYFNEMVLQILTTSVNKTKPHRGNSSLAWSLKNHLEQMVLHNPAFSN